MTEHVTVLTRKGQITVPAEVRRALGLKRGDKIAVILEDGEVRLTRAGSVVERTAGAVRTSGPPLTARELRAAAEEAWVEEAVTRGSARP
jgi:AbrB family looped-hinge helix DNA binding protein